MRGPPQVLRIARAKYFNFLNTEPDFAETRHLSILWRFPPSLPPLMATPNPKFLTKPDLRHLLRCWCCSSCASLSCGPRETSCPIFLPATLTRARAGAARFGQEPGRPAPVETAEALAPLASTAEETEYARQAEHLADHEVDQAFASALRQANLKAQHRTLTGDALALSQKVDQLKQLVAQDQAQVDSLTASLLCKRPRETRQNNKAPTATILTLQRRSLDSTPTSLTRQATILTARLAMTAARFKVNSPRTKSR